MSAPSPGTPARRFDRALLWLVPAAAVFLLNAAFSFHNVWPTPWIELRPEFSVEAGAAILLIALYRRLRGVPTRRFLAVLATIGLVMTVGRYMEVTAPALFGRGINLYWDTRYLPDVAAMFTAQASAVEVAGLVLALVAGAWLIWFLLYRSVAAVARGLAGPGTGAVLLTVGVFLVAGYLIGYYAHKPTLFWFSIPVTQTYARQTGFVIDAVAGPDAAERLPAADPFASIEPSELPRRDVFVTFVESYGAIAFDEPTLANRLEEPRQRLAAAIAGAGRSVVSAYLVAPTFGGGSWLSHISFLSGLEIDDPDLYSALLLQSRPTLPKLFGEAGFRTLALMPGLRNEWPEGSFYGFDAIIGAGALGYTGPEFGWWRIPDQYALAKLDATVLASGSAPAFVFFPTISTHSPFAPTPPYQPEWARVLSEEPFAKETLAVLDRPLPAMTELRPAYGDALAYTYDYWGGFLDQTREREFLLVLIGDHQPPANVSGPGARWDVPVHVITTDAALRERLRGRGFVAGLEPGETPIGAMHELGPLLFD